MDLGLRDRAGIVTGGSKGLAHFPQFQNSLVVFSRSYRSERGFLVTTIADSRTGPDPPAVSGLPGRAASSAGAG